MTVRVGLVAARTPGRAARLQAVDGFPETFSIVRLGLMHLKGLAKLQTLNLAQSKVTNAGVADLQKALPNCKISK